MTLNKKTNGAAPKTYTLLMRAFLLLCFSVVPISNLYAQNNAPAETPCDPEYFDSLKSRAWLEAQREITQNQNLIFKPDSVFEYTCFDLYVNELADHANDMFSETQRWGEVPGIDDQSMDRALQALVGEPLQQYIEQNFEQGGTNGPYDLLGGRSGEGSNSGGGGVGGGSDNTSIDHDIMPISGEQRNTYNCDIMNRIWEQAKCMDFIHNDENDGFFTFAEYRDDPDKRFLPSRCPKDPDQNEWRREIGRATVNGDGDNQTPWTEDEAESLLEDLDRTAQCTDTDPIPTGVTVRNNDNPQGYREFICILPGCYARPNATTCSPTP